MTVTAGRLYRAIRRLAERRNPVIIGTVSGMAGANRFLVVVEGAEQEMPAVGGATAEVGESVAVLINTQTGQPIGVLGAVKG